MAANFDHVDAPVGAVEILGAAGVTLVRGNECQTLGKSRIPAAILTMLAAEKDGVELRSLREVVSGRKAEQPLDDMNIAQHITRLRNDFKVPVEHVSTQRGGAYRLIPGMVRVDAFAFVDGVTASMADAEPSRIDELLTLWHGDPRRMNPNIQPAWWATSSLFKARNLLVSRVRDLPAGVRDALGAVGDFAALFPDDPEVDAIRPQASRPRVVVVEDQAIETFIDILPPSCDYEPITSLECWNRFVRDGGLADVQGVLIDLHLTAGRDDLQGYVIADHLRDHTRIPAIVMTAAPPARLGEMCARHRLLDVVFKGREGALNVTALAEAVTELVGTDRKSRERRIRAELDYWRYLIDASYRSTWRKEDVTRFSKDIANVNRLITDGDLDVAHRALEKLRKWWQDRR